LLAIVSISARSLIFVAKKTFKNLVALDVFGDIETIENSDHWFCIGKQKPYPKIDSNELLRKLKLASSMGCKAWIAGSGLEGNASLLFEAEKILPRYGMSIKTLESIYNPKFFFNVLRKFEIPFPEVVYAKKDILQNDDWLCKDLSSCGGMGIKKNNLIKKNTSGFFQKKISGIPMSVSIISNGESSKLIGFCKLINFSFKDYPYLYSGIIGPIRVSSLITETIMKYVSILIREFKLVGFFGLDFIIKKNEIFVLEINPRPTVSLEILEKYHKNSLFELHCQSTIIRNQPSEKDKFSNLKLIKNKYKKLSGLKTVYALKNIMLNKKKITEIKKLSFTIDCPSISSNFSEGQPICTVAANGIDENTLKFELEKKCLIVNKILFEL